MKIISQRLVFGGFSAILAGSMLLCGASYAADGDNETQDVPVLLYHQEVQKPTIDNYAIVLPSGYSFDATLATPLFSEMSKKGEKVTVIVDHSYIDSNHIVLLPGGTRLEGEITEIMDSEDDPNESPMINVHFDRLITPEGQVIPVSVTLNTRNTENFQQQKAQATNNIEREQADAVLDYKAINENPLLIAKAKSTLGSRGGIEAGKQKIYEDRSSAGMSGFYDKLELQEEVFLDTGTRLKLSLENPLRVEVSEANKEYPTISYR